MGERRSRVRKRRRVREAITRDPYGGCILYGAAGTELESEADTVGLSDAAEPEAEAPCHSDGLTKLEFIHARSASPDRRGRGGAPAAAPSATDTPGRAGAWRRPRSSPGNPPAARVPAEDQCVGFTVLFQRDGGFHRRRCTLGASGRRSISIGRDRRSDLVLDRSDISNHHAELRWLGPPHGADIGLRDLSSNGTCIKTPGRCTVRAPRDSDVAVPHGSIIFMPANLKPCSGQVERLNREWLIVELDDRSGRGSAAQPLSPGERQPDRVTVRVLAASQPPVSFTMRPTSPFIVMMWAWCQRARTDLGCVQFLLHDRELQPMDCPRNCWHLAAGELFVVTAVSAGHSLDITAQPAAPGRAPSPTPPTVPTPAHKAQAFVTAAACSSDSESEGARDRAEHLLEAFGTPASPSEPPSSSSGG